MYKRLLPYVMVAILSAVLTTVFQPLNYLQAWAQAQGQAQGQSGGSRCQTFPQTGKSVCGRFREYWQQNGGLPQQGYPISDTFTEVSALDGKAYTVQYFERAVFEFHPENKPPHDVLLSQLGTFRFQQEYPQGAPTPQPAAQTGSISGGLGFPSEVIPAMTIFAMEVAGPRYYSTTIRMNELSYTISGIAPGTYYVVGYLEGNSDFAGGYSQVVPCGFTANCNDHSLVPVTVKAGEISYKADVMDWYAGPNVFPSRPDLPLLGKGYMWPRQFPQNMVADPNNTWASDTSFLLGLIQRGGGQYLATVTGGLSSTAATPPNEPGLPVTVRGRQGRLYATGNGFSLYWMENGQPYAIIGGLSRQQVLALAESLEAIDRATWEARWAAVK